MEIETHRGEVVLAAEGDAVLLGGDPAAVQLVVRELERLTGPGARRLKGAAADSTSALATVWGLHASAAEYVRFSPEAMQRLRELGRIPSSSNTGYFRSFVRDGRLFAGNLDWAPVDVNPTQALMVQQAALAFALRAAIRDVAEAVQRVEGKVDILVNMVRAERAGQVLADQRRLRRQLDLAETWGSVSDTDWAAIAAIGQGIEQLIEMTRSYLRTMLDDDAAVLVRSRVEELSELERGYLREQLALLVISEDNLALWQRLRLIRITGSEPNHIASVTEDARRALDEHQHADEQLLSDLRTRVDSLSRRTGFEGLAIRKKHELAAREERVLEVLSWFAAQRSMDWVLHDHQEMPGLAESVGLAKAELTHRLKSLRGVARRDRDGADAATAAAHPEIGAATEDPDSDEDNRPTS